MPEAFNPDAYLSKKLNPTPKGFDPDSYLASRQLEAPKPDQSDDQKVGLGAAGFFTHLTNQFNPLSAPHGAEVLLRATSPATSGGFLERLKQGEEQSVVPRMDLNQIAAGIRTLVQAPFKKESIKDIYASEMEKQNAFENAVPEGAKTAGDLTGMALSLGLGAKNALSSVTNAKDIAQKAAFQSLKPSGKLGKMVSASPRAQQIGKQLLDDNIVTAGASFKDILKRTVDKLDDYGEEIGHFATQADNAVSRDSAIARINVQDIAQKVENKVIPQLVESGASDTAQTIQSWLNNNLKSAADANGDIGFTQLQKIKTTLGKTKAKFGATGDSLTRDAFQDVYGIVNDTHEQEIERALKTAGSPDDIKDFLKAKNAYHNLKSAKDFVEDTVGRFSNNRAFSLTDYGAAGLGGMAAKAASTPQTLAFEIAGAALNKGLRTRGNQIQASFFNTISKYMDEPDVAEGVISAIGLMNAGNTAKKLYSSDEGKK